MFPVGQLVVSKLSQTASLTTSHCQILPLKWVTTSVMCFLRSAWSSVLLIVPAVTPSVSHFGSWLCQTSTWPRTSWWFCWANLMKASAGPQLYVPRVGSRVSHFMTFSAVTVENWVEAIFVYVASV